MRNTSDLAAFKTLLAGVGKALHFRKGSGVTQTQDRADAIVEALERLVKQEVVVGIPADRSDRGDGTIGNAARLYIHEFGAPEANIPARPTVMPGIENSREVINRFMAQAARAAMDKDVDKAHQALHSAGLAAEDGIKMMINSNVPPPLSDRTIRERIERGITRTNTLIDQAEMRNAVTYVVRPKKAES